MNFQSISWVEHFIINLASLHHACPVKMPAAPKCEVKDLKQLIKTKLSSHARPLVWWWWYIQTP